MMASLLLMAASVIAGNGESRLKSGPQIGERVSYRLNIEQAAGKTLRVCDTLE